jgi:hypothetical protein
MTLTDARGYPGPANCDTCGVRVPGPSWHCRPCRFDMCRRCKSTVEMLQRSGGGGAGMLVLPPGASGGAQGDAEMRRRKALTAAAVAAGAVVCCCSIQ